MAGQAVGGYADPVFFTATAMIGMIALAGIVTRDSIILVDFIHQSVARRAARCSTRSWRAAWCGCGRSC